MNLGGNVKENRSKEKLAFKSSLNKQKSVSSSDDQSDGSNSQGVDFDYYSLPYLLVEYIMVEYSDGIYNKNWLKFY